MKFGSKDIRISISGLASLTDSRNLRKVKVQFEVLAPHGFTESRLLDGLSYGSALLKPELGTHARVVNSEAMTFFPLCHTTSLIWWRSIVAKA